jgi:hypothetical protein
MHCRRRVSQSIGAAGAPDHPVRVMSGYRGVAKPGSVFRRVSCGFDEAVREDDRVLE